MMRALWTSATGMKAQQLNVDVISNNLSNVNTTGYKGQRAEFKDLLYVNMQKSNRNEGVGRPVNLQVGHGVATVATTRDFKNGGLIDTQNNLDVAIEGSGFFSVQMPNENIKYTRDGSFKLSVEDGSRFLVTSDGYYVLSEDDDIIEIEEGLKELQIDELGYITAEDEDGEIVEIGRLKFVDFINPSGLLSEGKNLYSQTQVSGEAVDIPSEEMESKILQGYLESSNVQVVDEMVKMITAQRAYEINSKAITTADDMLQIANNLKR
ncbi:flagellar basal-body rod protein FlgG [Gottschalkia acidurici]|nr:flagellar basal-body rod protein FlgG [Gottschalkia acidurici]